jgi:hypothetical protein
MLTNESFFLSSFTVRMTDLIRILSDVNQGNHIRTGIENKTMKTNNDQRTLRIQNGLIE